MNDEANRTAKDGICAILSSILYNKFSELHMLWSNESVLCQKTEHGLITLPLLFSHYFKHLRFRCRTLKFSSLNVSSSLGRVHVLVVHSVLLTVYRQCHQQIKKEISKNLLTDMKSWRSIEVDEDLLLYICELWSNNVTSTVGVKYLTENNLARIPEEHKRLDFNTVSAIIGASGVALMHITLLLGVNV